MPKDKKDWVIYKDIKIKVTMEMLLDRYGLLESLKRSGKNLVGCCPIHKGTNPNQFSVSLERNLFNCFGDCRSGGNVLDFVARMEKVNLHEAAVLLQTWFAVNSSEPQGDLSPKKPKLVRERKQEAKNDGPINPPLSFKLRGLDYGHAFFSEKGISPETAFDFGAGYCAKGLMSGRIAIPIHNEKDELVAYCGRAVSQEQGREEGKYKLPGGFQKQKVVYNLNRQEPGVKILLIVESFLSVFKLYQYGFKNVVALMGSVLSDEQVELIASALGPDGQAILLFDADEDGQQCAEDSLKRLGRKVFVKAIDISAYGKKPHHLEAIDLEKLIKPI